MKARCLCKVTVNKNISNETDFQLVNSKYIYAQRTTHTQQVTLNEDNFHENHKMDSIEVTFPNFWNWNRILFVIWRTTVSKSVSESESVFNLNYLYSILNSGHETSLKNPPIHWRQGGDWALKQEKPIKHRHTFDWIPFQGVYGFRCAEDPENPPHMGFPKIVKSFIPNAELPKWLHGHPGFRKYHMYIWNFVRSLPASFPMQSWKPTVPILFSFLTRRDLWNFAVQPVQPN